MQPAATRDGATLCRHFSPKIVEQVLEEAEMLWLAFVVFFVLWILGLAGAIAVGAWVWLFFVIWIISLIAQFGMRRHQTPSVQP